MRARQLETKCPALWGDYFTFAVDRNPWDKTLSHYHFVKHRHADGNLSLDSYLDGDRFAVNYPRYCDDREQIMVDRVLRYEALDQELGEVFNKLGVPYPGVLKPQAKSGYRQDRREYQEIYTYGQRQRVAEIFSREIELHGYIYLDDSD